MFQMFIGATSANPATINWDFTLVTNFVGVFTSSGISNQNYSDFLIGVESTNSQTNRQVDSSASYFSGAAATSRSQLVSDGWVINDGGEITP